MYGIKMLTKLFFFVDGQWQTINMAYGSGSVMGNGWWKPVRSGFFDACTADEMCLKPDS